MAYQWTKDLETGNPTIDAQHRELIGAINRLLEACGAGRGRAEVNGTVEFLNSYIVKHFADEEALQVKYRYPGYQDHKKYHEGFKKVVGEIAAEFQREGASIPLVAKVNKSVAGWLINHIKKEDVKVAAHIRSAG